jgi:hypothetical protein
MNYHAKTGRLVAVPGTGRWMGITYLPDEHDEVRWEAQLEPFPVPERSAHALHFMQACQKGDIWPADKETAAACGVPFVPLNFVPGSSQNLGEWVPAKNTTQPARKAAE